MSPLLESELLPLECALLDIAQPLLGCAPLEVVVSGVGEIFAIFGVSKLCSVTVGFMVDGLRIHCARLGMVVLLMEYIK